jgi:predicted nucleotidyltransferase
MGLSKRYLEHNSAELRFSVAALADALKARADDVVFAYLLGSASAGRIKPYSDLDIAVYTSSKPDFSLYDRAQEAVDAAVGDVRCDLGILNGAEPIYRFEAINGVLLFARDQEAWLRFYSRTSREYEHQLYDYEKQRRYRVEALR